MIKDSVMARRHFMKLGASKVAEAGSKLIEHKVNKNAERWIRPPFAKAELDFLLNCSRCGDCIDACPHQVIFPLAISAGASVVSTPAMDIINKGCHLCDDWPCVTACTEKALSFPEKTDNSQMPKPKDCPPMAKAKINIELCLPYSGPECGACRSSCPVTDCLIWNNEKPSIKTENCIGCGLCKEACITSPKSIDISTIKLQ